MADVQVAVRLRRKARDHALKAVPDVSANALTDEICEVFGHADSEPVDGAS